MNPTHKILDARGLPCPQPVILTRKALAEGGFETLEVRVDDPASRENLLKFAEFSKCRVVSVEDDGPGARIVLAPGDAALPAPAQAPAPVPAGAATVLIATDRLGQGEAELGKLLMRGFLYTLTEAEVPPRRVILMNAGVTLAVEGSEHLVNLRRLAERGVELLACGTCLEFYKLTEQLGAGRVTNMYEIAEHLLQGPTVTLG